MPKIYDNIENHLTKGLNETLDLSVRTDFCVGYFNLRGWKEVADAVDVLAGEEITEGNETIKRTCRLLVGMQKLPIDLLREQFSIEKEASIDQAEAVKLKKRLAQEFKDQLTIGIPTEVDEQALRKLSQQMKDKKVVVKLHLRYPLHAKLYLAYSNDVRVPKVGFLGSSNLTLAGLARQGELNIDVIEQDAADKLALWFKDRWNDRWCLDITKELIEIIDNSWAADRLISPYHIYLKIAYHLSGEARAGINEFTLPRVFQKELLEYQQKAVLISAHHLHKQGGVLIGDVVGLGKTIVATALAKLFEDDFFLETLIICPKNIKRMWEDYAHKYQLRAKVISQSNVQNELPELRRYRLVIIDESQNLRNSEGSRYRAIKSYIEENESKVILLSATPYNKSYLDLSNQLRLFIADDKDLGISPDRYIESLGGRVQYSASHSDFIRSIKAFEKSNFSDDWKELMRLYMVRRTRSFIKNNYAEIDTINGRKYLTFSDGTRSYFPDRIPRKVEYEFDPNNPHDQYAKLYSNEVVDIINSLLLPRYGLGNFLNKQPKLQATNEEKVIINNLTHAGPRLKGFCRTNLFKRLESSGYSFRLSLSRHVLRNYVFIYAIENNLPLPIGKNIIENLDDYLEDMDLDNNGEEFISKFILNEEKYLENAGQIYKVFNEQYHNRFGWIKSELFIPQLLLDLINDSREILKILKIDKDWKPAEDRQLNALFQLLANTHAKEKVLVFTQYADTANYLAEQLKKRGLANLESVTGESENPTEFAYRFSPQSNGIKNMNNGLSELRVLIATDVLSEGQNLQDAHIVLNYDLPWAIIRLIQRSGRVDRIGQKSEQIICYSVLPEEGLEKILDLRGRLKDRIGQNAEVIGADETFFDGDPVNIADLYNERSGILDEDKDDNEVDLASFAYQIWKNATDQDPSLNNLIPDLPNVIYSTKQTPDKSEKEGVIVYSRTSEENDILAWIDTNGKVVTKSQYSILKAAECDAATPPKYKLNTHHELVKKSIEYILEDEKNIGASLGKKSGVKYRVYMLLDRYCKENENTLFITDILKKSVDDIYKYPLKEFAREILNRQLRTGISDDDLAAIVISLKEEDKLCIIDNNEQRNIEPQIICSLGLSN